MCVNKSYLYNPKFVLYNNNKSILISCYIENYPLLL